MKILLDNCVWSEAAEELRDAGHDVEWVGSWGQDPGDEEILIRAHAEGRTLVTLDKDFGELAVIRRIPHSGIIRLVDLSVRQHAEFCLKALARHGVDLQRGAIVTVKKTRIRFRSPDEPDLPFELLNQIKPVPLAPALDDPPVLDPDDLDPSERDFPA